MRKLGKAEIRGEKRETRCGWRVAPTGVSEDCLTVPLPSVLCLHLAAPFPIAYNARAQKAFCPRSSADRALASGARGRRFKSCRGYLTTNCRGLRGSGTRPGRLRPPLRESCASAGTKGAKSASCRLRTVQPMPPADWLAVQGDEDGALFHPINKGGHIIRKAMSSQVVYNMLEKRAEEASVKSLSPRDMRRTFVGSLLDAGADIATVARPGRPCQRADDRPLRPASGRGQAQGGGVAATFLGSRVSLTGRGRAVSSRRPAVSLIPPEVPDADMESGFLPAAVCLVICPTVPKSFSLGA